MNLMVKQLYEYVVNKGFEMDEGKLDKALKYLAYYGYLAEDKTSDVGNIIEAVAKFQDFVGIEVDGIVGPKTSRIMDIPRCGVPDFIQDEANLRKWKKKSLTYYIESRDKDISKNEWDAAIAQAFANIDNVCDIKIQASNSNNADIIIRVGTGSQNQLDNQGGTLAWAQLPPGNDSQLVMMIDTAETWKVDINKVGIYLVAVVCHEGCHNMGVSHISTPGSLMNPFYNQNISTPQKADIEELVARYGKPVIINPTPPTPTTPSIPDGIKEMNIKFSGKIESINLPGYRIYVQPLQ